MITMSAREVVAFRGEFTRREETYSDAGVARDEIASLEARQEPVVLRVSSKRLSAKARASVDGDWLCEPSSAAVRVPKPIWGRNFSSREWSAAREWVEAWETCDQAGWMAYAATDVGCDRRLVVAALCACVRRFEPDHNFRGRDHVLSLLTDTEAWARGDRKARSPRESIRDHAAHLDDPVVRGGGERVRATVDSTRHAAEAAEAGPDDAPWAASNCVEAIVLRLRQERHTVSADLADVLRERITTLDVLRAAAASGRGR